jgi:hypothetical protein
LFAIAFFQLDEELPEKSKLIKFTPLPSGPVKRDGVFVFAINTHLSQMRAGIENKW